MRFCWIDIYFESLDLITSNANKQFIVREFKQYAINMKIRINIVSVKTHHSINMKIRINIVSVKTHHSINMIERYHESFRRIYAIIIAKIFKIDSNSILQMSFKAFNDLTDFDDLIFTLSCSMFIHDWLKWMFFHWRLFSDSLQCARQWTRFENWSLHDN